MKHYTLTAEQMQRGRETLRALMRVSVCFCHQNYKDPVTGKCPHQNTIAFIALLDAAVQAPEATDPLDRPMGGHLLDSVRYPVLPEATAGGDVREAAEAMVCVVDGYINETATIHQLKAANASLAAALAAAPKPCEHGCVDGKVLITPARGNNYEAPCPIHGTKPEAPTDAWQPIETAPKDGTHIIIGWHPNGQVSPQTVCEAFWHSFRNCWHAFYGQDVKPTHWMPFPIWPTSPAPKEERP